MVSHNPTDSVIHRFWVLSANERTIAISEQKEKLQKSKPKVTNLALIRFSRANAASTFPTPSSARTITSHVDGY